MKLRLPASFAVFAAFLAGSKALVLAAPPETPGGQQKATRIPFRLKFGTYSLNPKKPGAAEFEVRTLDFKQPSVFLKIGDVIPHTKLKLLSFHEVMNEDPSTHRLEDVSELTVVDTETNERTVLVFNRVVDLPSAR